MSEKVIRLNRGDGTPEIEVIIGQAQWGKYFLYLWDANGVNHTLIGSGLNTDQIPDKFRISPPTLPNLNGYILNWDVRVIAFSDKPGQLYSVTIKITQNGNLVANGQFDYNDAFDGAKVIDDFVRLIVI